MHHLSALHSITVKPITLKVSTTGIKLSLMRLCTDATSTYRIRLKELFYSLAFCHFSPLTTKYKHTQNISKVGVQVSVQLY